MFAVRAFVVVMGCLVAAGCASPINVERVDTRTANAELTANALSTGQLSGWSRNVLRRYGLLQAFETTPEATIAALHRLLASEATPDLLFALAETSFAHAEKTAQKQYYLASTVYAYAFLFPDQPAARPNPFDPRLRVAADLYNRGLASGLATPDGTRVDLRAGDFTLPFGKLAIALDSKTLRWADRDLNDYVPAAQLEITGLRNRYRDPGIGAPLAASFVPGDETNGFQVARLLKVPVTAVLRLNASAAAIAGGRIEGMLDLYPGNEPLSIRIGDQMVPLETERSVALAYSLSNPTIWRIELAGFLQGDLLDRLPTQLVSLEPYQPGRFPVVFVHGTASSAGRWADMINDLQNDPEVSQHFQFWMFMYNSGNPVPISALQLRQSLQAAIDRVDPQHHDPALHDMIVVGHSQGGLARKDASGGSRHAYVRCVQLAPARQIADIRSNARTDPRRASCEADAGGETRDLHRDPPAR